LKETTICQTMKRFYGELNYFLFEHCKN